MRRTYSTRDKGSRDKQKLKIKRQRKISEQTEERTEKHPKFGNIPMIKVTYIAYNGRPYETWDYSPYYEPPLPKGAIRGDIRKQEFCRMCHTPRYYFEDIPRTCVQCGEDFIFGAKEQKYWYETLKFHFASEAIRCPKCRRLKRSIKALNNQISATKKSLKENPDDPALLLSLAETIAKYHQRTGSGDLNEAVSCCRKALKLWTEAIEALYWEGYCHSVSGRSTKAKKLLDEFITKATKANKHKSLVKKANRILTAEKKD